MPFVLLLVLFYSISTYTDLTPLAVSSDSQWYQYLTFNLCHVSFLHLTANSIAFLLYWRILRYHSNLFISIPTVLLSATLSAILSASISPTMGISSIVYAMIGIYVVGMKTPYHISKPLRIRFLIILILSFAITVWLPSINTLMHVYSILFSTIFSFLSKKYMYAPTFKK